jgi:hypothetical protein
VFAHDHTQELHLIITNDECCLHLTILDRAALAAAAGYESMVNERISKRSTAASQIEFTIYVYMGPSE